MTLSVPSFLAAATSVFMPPPAAAEVAVAQLVALALDVLDVELDEELDDEQPAASSAAAATPTANRYDDLTTAS